MTCDVLSRFVTQHVTVSCQCLTQQPLLVTNHNKIPRVQSYYRHKIYYWSHYEGAHTRWLLKYLAQCETINYV